MTARLIPVLLAGGAGMRLRSLHNGLPKQFLSLPPGGPSLLQQAAMRALLLAPAQHVITLASAQFQVEAARHLAAISPGLTSHLLAEPVGRNTAAACLIAALHARALSPEREPVLWLMPCDHKIENHAALTEDLHEAARLAAHGAIVTFGIAPERADPHFGYLLGGNELFPDARARAVTRFIEKPEPEVAASLIAQGNCYWNSGMFVAEAGRLITAAAQHAPALLAACQNAFATCSHGPPFTFSPQPYREIPALPIDRAVMEHAADLAVLPAAFDWADIGSKEAWRRAGGKETAPGRPAELLEKL